MVGGRGRGRGEGGDGRMREGILFLFFVSPSCRSAGSSKSSHQAIICYPCAVSQT